jgi:phosphate/sulfate permease
MSTIIGSITTFLALAAVLGIYIWSSRIINTIHERRLDSLRRIKKEIGRGRKRENTES